MPTLLWRMSIRPYSFTHAAAMASQLDALVMSASKQKHSPPSSRISFSVSLAESRSRSTSITRAPSRANRMAVARPFPIVSPGV